MRPTVILCFVLVGCEGAVIGGAPGPSPEPITAAQGVPQPPVTPGPGDMPVGQPAGPSWPVTFRGSASSLRRLTRDELIETFEDLTGEAPAREDLPIEARTLHQPLVTVGRALRSNELATYSFVVEGFSARIAPSMLTQAACPTPPAGSTAAADHRRCLGRWATTFATRALRRGLRADEETLFGALLAGADGTSANDRAAVAAVLNAVFQAPSFLYRSEIGSTAGGTRVLTGTEIATRLSYLGTLGPPDESLLADAAAGRLLDPQVRVAHFERLRQTPRGERAMAVMVLEWLGANEQKLPTKSTQYLAGLPMGFENDLRASAEGTIIDVLRSAHPTLEHLFTTESYLSNPAVGLVTRAGATSGDTAGTRRGGLLMHPHVLAANTKENGASPFQLGSMLKESILCEPLPPPPAGATMQARSDVPQGATLREIFEHRTNASAECTACHQLFAPMGYAFLPFDPAGRWLKQDSTGKPWNLAGSSPTYSGQLTFGDPRQLSETLGASRQVHGCFAQFAASWTLGRGLMTADQALVDELDATVKRSGGDLVELVRAVIRSSTFVAPPPGA